jgi:serine/threonine-protein kinase
VTSSDDCIALAPAPHQRVREPNIDDLIARIKRGGMGTVYLARHTGIGKRVAVKILSPPYATQRDVVRRFLQEARATSELCHPHIVDVSDFGHTASGQAYLVMEYLEGEDIAETVRRDGPMPWIRVAPMLLPVCAALDAAHRCGVIHRDIKPSNCFRIYHAGNPPPNTRATASASR